MELWDTPLWDDVTERRETTPVDLMRITLQLDANARKSQIEALLQVFYMPDAQLVVSEFSVTPMDEINLTLLGNRLHGLIHLALDDMDPF